MVLFWLMVILMAPVVTAAMLVLVAWMLTK